MGKVNRRLRPVRYRGLVSSILRVVRDKCLFMQRCMNWRLHNKNNFTIPGSIFPIHKVAVGDYTYGRLNVFSASDLASLTIGRFCSISDSAIFLLSGEHSTKKLSTYPFMEKYFRSVKREAISCGDIRIGDDVWIGARAIILSGITIGQGAIIAAGSVVTKDVAPYAVVGGVPACLIHYRFSAEIISQLLTFDYKDIDDSFILRNKDKLDEDMSIELLREFKEDLRSS